MRMTAVLCGCIVLAGGCIASPFEPSKTDMPTLYQRTYQNSGEPMSAASTPDDFKARGWNCQNSPVPGRVVCSRPNQAFPVPAFPPNVPPQDRPVTVTLLAWENGVFAGTILLIRPEVYAGQPCSSTGEAYIFRPIIGYYECLNR